ncbi:hypothetical protein [Thiolapillus sp.]
MRKSFHRILVAVLVAALFLLGLQSVSFAGMPVEAGSVTTAAASVSPEMSAGHECSDCEKSMDCCASQDCQTAPHCVSYNAIGGTAGTPAVDHGNIQVHSSFDAVPASMLIPTIYRPPWT